MPAWIIVVVCLFGGSSLISMIRFMLTPAEALVYVDNSLSEEGRLLVDGAEVTRVFPNLLEKIVLPAGKHILAVRDPLGKVSEQIEVSLTRDGRYVYNPGATRQYEVVTWNYSPGGLGGGRETRYIAAARWHDVDRFDHLFESVPSTISTKVGERTTRTQLMRRTQKQ